MSSLSPFATGDSCSSICTEGCAAMCSQPLHARGIENPCSRYHGQAASPVQLLMEEVAALLRALSPPAEQLPHQMETLTCLFSKPLSILPVYLFKPRVFLITRQQSGPCPQLTCTDTIPQAVTINKTSINPHLTLTSPDKAPKCHLCQPKGGPVAHHQLLAPGAEIT